MKYTPPPFFKNADVRAGKAPGWPGKPETNGDPYDPNNLGRTDAALVISEGTVLRNALSMNAAQKISLRRGILFVTALMLWLLAGNTVASIISSVTGGAPVSIFPDMSSVPDDVEDSQLGSQAQQLISDHYGTGESAVAKKYDMSFFIKHFGWPEEVAGSSESSQGKAAGVWFTQDEYDTFKAIEEGEKNILVAAAMRACRWSLTLDCISRMNDKSAQFHSLIHIGKDPKSYISEGPKPDEDKEKILATFLQKFPKDSKSYCDSKNRLYAETWNGETAQQKISEIAEKWEKGDFDFTDEVVRVKSIQELNAHRLDGDKECRNIHVAAMKIGAGALDYLVSVKARNHTAAGDHIGTALYFLADVGGKRVMPIIACANCGSIDAFNEAHAENNSNQILPGLKDSAEGIIEAFARSGYEVKGE